LPPGLRCKKSDPLPSRVFRKFTLMAITTEPILTDEQGTPPAAGEDVQLAMNIGGMVRKAGRRKKVERVTLDPDAAVQEYKGGVLIKEATPEQMAVFEAALPRIYSQAGFSVVARLDFDAKVLRAEGIDVDAFKKTFKEFNNGEPDVVFMVLAPDEVKVYRPGDGGRVKTYEDGIKAQQQALQAGGP